MAKKSATSRQFEQSLRSKLGMEETPEAQAAEALNEFTRVQNLFGTPGRIKRPEEFRA